MQTTVELQDPFSYSFIPIILLIIIIACFVLYFIIKHIMKNKKQEKNAEEVEKIDKIEVPKKENLEQIKNKYLIKLDELMKKVNAEKIQNRKAYQELSLLIRMFVYEVTKIKVQNYTLADIKKLKKQELTELIQEYYPPEFEKTSKGDILLSIEKTRKVIEKWN